MDTRKQFKEVKPGVFETSTGEQFTNHQQLPMEVVAAVMMDRYTEEGEDPWDYSASTLTTPHQVNILKKRHKENLRIFDVTEKFPTFFGSVAHQVMEDAWHEEMGSVPEERIYMEVLGKIVSGKLDLYHEPEIRDYKTCKVYKIMNMLVGEWEKGQNIYAALCRKNDKPVDRINVVAMMNDWSRGEMYKPKYPVAAIQIIPLKVWTQEEAMGFIQTRVQELIEAEAIEDAARSKLWEVRDEAMDCDEFESLVTREADVMLMERFSCTEEEMWQRVKDHCILKGDSDRAVSGTVRETAAECYAILAEKYADKPEYKVVKRWTKRTRCEDYCECAPICRQNMILNGIDPDAPAPLF